MTGKTRICLAALAATVILLPTACGGAGSGDSGGALQVMFGSSGEAETAALKAATERFTKDTGIDVQDVPAEDLTQQLTQGFAGGQPPDVFYASPAQVRQFASSMYPYGSKISDLKDFDPALVKSYTIDGNVYCLPKDGGTLALVIDTKAWQAAGLTAADYPKTWDQLSTVAKKLTKGKRVGLAFKGAADIVGAFLRQAGGWFVNDDMTKATADSPENLEALKYVQQNLKDGDFAYAEQLETKWGGEAIGTGKAAMTIEGSWLVGAMKADYPNVKWTAVDLPAGPAGPGTMQFSNCWGIAAKSAHRDEAVRLVEHLASAAEQKTFAQAFGPDPSRVSLQDWAEKNLPGAAAFTDYAHSKAPVPLPSFTSVLDDFNAQLKQLASSDPKQMLAQLQTNEEAAVKDQQ